MRSLQDNLNRNKTDQSIYKSMFVWNEYLTRGIRKQLKNNIWTVALVYGFFKQVSVYILVFLPSQNLYELLKIN